MGRIRFNDGYEFDTSGPMRIERRADGLYVVGDGMLCAVDTREKGERMIVKHYATRHADKLEALLAEKQRSGTMSSAYDLKKGDTPLSAVYMLIAEMELREKK